MELSQDKRKNQLNIILQVLNITVACLILLFYSYLGIKTVIFFAFLLLFLIILPYKIKLLEYFQTISFYVQILIYFIPVALSLNYSPPTLNHWIILFLLISSVAIVLFTKEYIISISREKIYFALFATVFLLALTSFVYFVPIKDEYESKIELTTVILKSLYLLFLFFLLYVSLNVLGELKYLISYSILKPEKKMTIFLVLIILLSLYDISNIRKKAEICIQNSFKRCESNLTDISGRLKVKGLNRQNVSFLKGYLRNSLDNMNRDAIKILDYASKLYPYECDFYRLKLEYYRRFQMNERLEESLKRPPAPIKKACKNM